MLLSPSQSTFVEDVAGGWPGANRERALYLAAEAYHAQPGGRVNVEGALLASTRDLYRLSLIEDGYGNPILLFILLAIASGAIAWAVKRLLDWLFPESPAHIHAGRERRLLDLQAQWRLGQ